jgi:hypothetical protein
MKASDNHLSWDKVFEESYLADLEIASAADLENSIQAENPSTFGN